MQSVDKKSALVVPCFPPTKRHHHCIRDRGSHHQPHLLLFFGSRLPHSESAELPSHPSKTLLPSTQVPPERIACQRNKEAKKRNPTK
ncbi:hypothetical protein BDP55DRAFT_673726 [Colletotrichum godetiae]|uniref:Uncharacterized protein n=1 Tax=Colletotrichum godetiae TaxID=1209918 RepID=A0AAJ0ESA8_9PEZI|nr:uncharacterized protein BDP55DRAFT_673726 [Colletotrichum godetiae]KAK1672143.1 hypothetical protein BDP55DRAFT_673726 [Colletotrichum godetiae]